MYISVTAILILISSIFTIYSLKNPLLSYRFSFIPNLVYTKKEFYRFLTSGLVHNDYRHLIFNMLSLYFFGDNLESSYLYYFGSLGKYYFLIFYLFAIIVSNLPSFFKYKKDPNYHSLGASGGVNAIVFSSILYSPVAPICIFGVICLPGFIYGILYIIYSLYLEYNVYNQRINHMAHITGAFFGIVFNSIINPKIILFFIYKIKYYLFSML